MNEDLHTGRIGDERRRHSATGLLLAIALLLIVGSPRLHAQTLLGQNGSLSTPSADTYPAGNFAIGSFFRSSCFQPTRFDATSIYMITGLSPTSEASFSFPGVWGNKNPPAHFDNPAHISFKQQVYSMKNNRYRFAVEGLMQRRPVGEDSVYDQSANWGVGVLGSGTIDRNTYHLFLSRMVSRGTKRYPKDFAGAGVDRFITEKLQFSADIYAVSESFFTERTDFTTLLGTRYRINQYLQAVAGGGVGMTRGSNDWQYLIGLSFTTDIAKNVYATMTEAVPPPFPSDSYEQPGYDALVGIPPPGTPEIMEAPHTNGNGNGNGKKKAPFIFTRVFFDENSFDLNEPEQQNLGFISRDISKLGRDQCFTVMGHADPTGTSQDNFAIAMSRALSVATRLIDSAGVAPENVILGGAGEELLSDSRSSTDAWQMNRRVELRTCNRLSVQLDTIPDDSCTIQQAIQWHNNTQFPPVGFTKLSEQLDNCLKKVGSLKEGEFYVISPKWDPAVDYRTTIYRTALFWLYTVQMKQVDPKLCFLKLQPASNFLGDVTADALKPEYAVDSRMITTKGGKKSTTMKIRLINRDIKNRQAIYTVLAAKVDGKLIASTGETLAESATPDYRKSRLIRFRMQVDREYTLPLTASQRDAAEYQVYYFDAQGKYLGVSTVVSNQVTTGNWAKRFATALHLQDKTVNQAEVLQINIRKYRSNDLKDFLRTAGK